jgi:hypothetical protein
MKKIAIAALIAAQVASPAAAADLVEDQRVQERRMGTFAGARIRISLDRAPNERVRAGLALSPAMHDARADGTARMRIGEGLEYGLTERRAPELSFAGRPVREIVAGADGPDGRRNNISPAGWVAIGVGVAAIALFAWYVDAGNRATD